MQGGLVNRSTSQDRVRTVRLSVKAVERAQHSLAQVAANPNLVNHEIDRRSTEGDLTSPESGEPFGAKIGVPWDSRSGPIRPTVLSPLLSGEALFPAESSSNGSDKRDAWSTCLRRRGAG